MVFVCFTSLSIFYVTIIIIWTVKSISSFNPDEESNDQMQVLAPFLHVVFYDEDKKGGSVHGTMKSDTSHNNTRHLDQISSEMLTMLNMINSERREHFLPELCFNTKLNEAALDHSNDMSINQYFSHTGIDGSQFWDRIKRTGYHLRGGAENLATDWSIESAHKGLMNSQGHRENILHPRLQHIGIGITKYEIGSGYKFSGNLVITQVFGVTYGEDECIGDMRVNSDDPPTSTPSKSQAAIGVCDDSPFPFKVDKTTFLYCHWVRDNTDERCNISGISSHCPETCSTCNECVDSSIAFRAYKTLKCQWVAKKAWIRCKKAPGVEETCRNTCGLC